MKKLIEKLYGAKVHATAKNIKGKKSSGREDNSSYNHWEKISKSGWNSTDYL